MELGLERNLESYIIYLQW